MLIVWRLVFGCALAYVIFKVRQNAADHPDTGDLLNAGYLALAVALGILNAIVWAPYFGSKVSDPITGTLTDGAFIDQKNGLVQTMYFVQAHGWRRLTLFMCFLEGIRHPHSPSAFVIGLRNSRPGSWLEKAFAREVFRFNNIQNCVVAHQILKNRGLDPGPHASPEVNIVLHSLRREPKPEPWVLAVPPAAPPPPLRRDLRIQLFNRKEPVSSAPRH